MHEKPFTYNAKDKNDSNREEVDKPHVPWDEMYKLKAEGGMFRLMTSGFEKNRVGRNCDSTEYRLGRSSILASWQLCLETVHT